ncbi:hypothetical protein JCM8547_008093 [Rhodosporidiobolus lusitaniae]
MLFSRLLALSAPLLASVSASTEQQQTVLDSHDHPHSPTPQLNFLFTAHLNVEAPHNALKPGPQGIRLDLPIKGGHTTGVVEGKIRSVGADWVTVDPASGVSTADARWSIVVPAVVPSPTSSGTPPDDGPLVDNEIFVTTNGPSLPGANNKAHLRMRFETSVVDNEFAWLNWICGIGVLEILNPENTTLQEVKIDVYNLEGEYGPTRPKA